MGSLGMGLNNAMTFVYSLLIPTVQYYVGVRVRANRVSRAPRAYQVQHRADDTGVVC